MTAHMDLNNEMVLMRKEINRARIRAISRIVRRVRNLRNKKGDEAQKAKNTRRAARFVEELDILKDLKPDAAFKFLLNRELNTQDFMNAELSLEQRALMRVGSASFIQKRMHEIGNKIAEFQNLHGSKSLSKAFADRLHSDKQRNPEEGHKESSGDERKLNAAVGVASRKHDEDLNSPKRDKTRINTATRNDKITERDYEKEAHCEGKEEPEMSLSNDDDSIDVKEVDVLIGSDQGNHHTEIQQEVGSRTQDVTLPNYERKAFNLLAEAKGADDITDLLPNIGADFDPDDGAGSDCDIESAAVDNSEERQKNENKLDAEDPFFVDEGDPDSEFRRPRNKQVIFSSQQEKESLNQVKSCFLESLANVSHQRTKGKNRMSQRARKQFASNPGEDKSANVTNVYKEKCFKGKASPSIKNASTKPIEARPIHPSWEASKKRKQAQAAIGEIQGKRICFEDSD